MKTILLIFIGILLSGCNTTASTKNVWNQDGLSYPSQEMIGSKTTFSF